MPTFIEKSHCHGVAPEGTRAKRHSLRPHIIGELLGDRLAPRFLVAPKGYGKTSIAFEYAQIMFDFEHVFWIRGDSPCFLRDLDGDALAESVFRVDASASLLVCDDVPHLDDTRMKRFAAFVDEVIERGCEILVTCIPAAENVAGTFRDAMVLGAHELLLTDDELEMEQMRGGAITLAQPSSGPSRRMCDRAAGMVWDGEGARCILAGIKDEGLTATLRSLAFGILVLGSGDIRALAPFADERTFEEDISYLEKRYPYLGIDFAMGRFDAIVADCESLRQKGGFSLLGLESAAPFAIDAEPGWTIATILLDGDAAKRACDFARTFLPRAKAGEWLVREGWRLVMMGQMEPLLDLASHTREECPEARSLMDAQCAWALLALEDLSSAERMARRAIRSDKAPWTARCACWALACAGIEVASPIEAKEALEVGLPMTDCDDALAKETADRSPLDWETFFACCHGVLDGLVDESTESVEAEPGTDRDDTRASTRASREDILRSLRDAVGHGDPRMRAAGCLAGAWAIGATARSAASDGELAAWAPLAVVLTECLETAVDESDGGALPLWVWHECASVLDALFERMPFAFDCRLTAPMLSQLHGCAAELASQGRAYRRRTTEAESRQRTALATRPDSPRYDRMMHGDSDRLRTTVPMLEVRMFGGFDVRLEGKLSESRVLARRKAKVTLAILMLSKGREVSKERVTEALWPGSEFETRQRNFYVVWSDLRRALSLDSGCPYLIRSQTGYRLDRRYVSSDLDEFDDLCHDLLFGDDDMETWRQMFDKASGDFAEDLLPGMQDNEFINSMRSRCRTQLVDGLVAASVRMDANGEHRGAIWFAREALRRDAAREDAYIAMMVAQLNSDQRGAALETYFACRHHLSEQLGIDPSPRIMELYRSIIETEEVF